jgi:hypothetical protein
MNSGDDADRGYMEPLTMEQGMLLAPRDAGRILGLSSSRMAQLDREGRLPALRDSAGRRLFTVEAVERYRLERAQSEHTGDQRGVGAWPLT